MRMYVFDKKQLNSIFFCLKIKKTWNSPVHGANVINPFSRGNCWLDCLSTLCGPLPPSFLDLRALVKQENNTNTIRYHPDDNGIFNNRVWDSSIEYPSQQQQQHRYIPRDYV